jgi:hypothetical protein
VCDRSYLHYEQIIIQDKEQNMERAYNNIRIPAARMKRHPKFASPRLVKRLPPLSFFLSLLGSGLCRASSGSCVDIYTGRPHDAGEGDNEYCNGVRQIGMSEKIMAAIIRG